VPPDKARKRCAFDAHVEPGYMPLLRAVAAPVIAESERRCWPAASKFSATSQVSIAVRISGHSVSRIEYHAVSRFRPLTIMWLNQMPSNRKPRRRAAARLFSLSALQRHCILRYLRSSIAYASMRNRASVAPLLRANPGANQMPPISITPLAGWMSKYVAMPTAAPVARSQIA
jgi:hypothetical protein